MSLKQYQEVKIKLAPGVKDVEGHLVKESLVRENGPGSVFAKL